MLGRLSTLALVLFLCGSGLRAADLYAGAGVSGTIEAGALRDGLESFAEADGSTWKLFAGARFGPYLAVEIATHDLGRQRCCDAVADLGFNSDVSGYSAAGLGRWPLGRITPFFKVGLMTWEEDGELITLIGPTPSSVDGTDLLVGAGLEADLPGRLGLRAEWERYEFDAASSDGVWASLLVRF